MLLPLLIGGDKTGNPRWYDEYVPIADQLFDDHLQQIRQDQRKEKEKKSGKEF